MIRWIKAQIKRVWPPLRLRTILLGTLILVASLPGFAAMFLRVYENTLVQQTEAQLTTASAAIAGAWAGEKGDMLARETPSIDLTRLDTLPPAHVGRARAKADPDAAAATSPLMPMVQRLRNATGASVALLDANAVPIPAGGPSYLDYPEVRQGLSGKTVTVLRPRHNPYGAEPITRAANIILVHVRPVVADGKVRGLVLIQQEPRDVFAGMWADRWNIAIGAASILLLLLLLAGLLSRAIGRPIETLNSATRDVAQRAITIPPVSPLAAVEIQSLYESFGTMADRVERRTRYLRDFAAAMSHEFKTPLTGIRGVIELIEEHGDEMGDEERSRFLANAHADADRLSMLVQRLLDLARADMADPISPNPIDARAVLDRIAKEEMSGTFAVQISGQAEIAMSEDALTTIAQALIDNSRKAGASRVELHLRMEGNLAILRVSDDGPGIPPADAARIFEPFFTSRRETGGTGLGLPIVQSLINASGGSIASVKSAQGACFEVRVPSGK